MYPPGADWRAKFGLDRDPPPGRPKVQVKPARHAALARWLATQLGSQAPPTGGPRLWEYARDAFARLVRDWVGPVTAEDGLIAVLMQGAVTLADHATAAASRLARAGADDCACGPRDARRARARAGAMRLFAQRVRVAPPHQLLRAAIAGPRYASVLLEQANAFFVLDELHAYDPATFGRICAAMRLWDKLGSRTAVLSATLAPPMTALIADSLTEPGTIERAPARTAPDPHRPRLDDQPITGASSLNRIRGWLAAAQSVLAVTNTVATAPQLYPDLLAAA